MIHFWLQAEHDLVLDPMVTCDLDLILSGPDPGRLTSECALWASTAA